MATSGAVLLAVLGVWLSFAAPYDRAGEPPTAKGGTALQVEVDRRGNRALVRVSGRVRRSSSDAPVAFRVLGRPDVAPAGPAPTVLPSSALVPPEGSVRVGWRGESGRRPGVALARGRVFRSAGTVAVPTDGALRLCVHLVRAGDRATILRTVRVVVPSRDGTTPLSVALVPIVDAATPWVGGLIGLAVFLLLGRGAIGLLRTWGIAAPRDGGPDPRGGVRVRTRALAMRWREAFRGGRGRDTYLPGDGTGLPPLPPNFRVPDAPPGEPGRRRDATSALRRETASAAPPAVPAESPIPCDAGRSARAEGERRTARWRARRRAEVEAAGGVWDPDEPVPSYIAAWETGAVGEEEAAAQFAALGPTYPRVRVLHDRRESVRARANIDHVLVGPAGVVVADTKAWSGRAVVRDRDLVVAGRKRSEATIGVLEQVGKVHAALERAGLRGVPIFGVLHWLNREGLVLDGRLAPRGVPLLDAKGVLLRAHAGNDLDDTAIAAVVEALERELPPAARARAARS